MLQAKALISKQTETGIPSAYNVALSTLFQLIIHDPTFTCYASYLYSLCKPFRNLQLSKNIPATAPDTGLTIFTLTSNMKNSARRFGRFGNGCRHETIGLSAVLKVHTSHSRRWVLAALICWIRFQVRCRGEIRMHWALSPLLCSLCRPHLPHLLQEVIKGLCLSRLNTSSYPIRLRKQLLRCVHVTRKLEHFENFEHSAWTLNNMRLYTLPARGWRA